MTTKQNFDIGIVVPLIEEFRYIEQLTPRHKVISYQGTYFYSMQFGSISAVCGIVGDMGPLPASRCLGHLLSFANVKLLIVLGLAGALSKEVSVGDVVIASEVNEFEANSKAESIVNGHELRRSGRHWPLSFAIKEAINHFEFSAKELFSKWQTSSFRDYNKLDIRDKESICPPRPSLHLGPIASGNVVAASKSFVQELKTINRKFLAIDMESAGIIATATERIHPIPCLVIRGISDHADEAKKDLDSDANGGWRGYSIRNATSLLIDLLSWAEFLRAGGLSLVEDETNKDNVLRELVMRVQSSIGGPWIVGVAFGLYFYGPHTSTSAPPIPMDLSRLCILDKNIGALVNEAFQIRVSFLSNGQLEQAEKAFLKLINDFRHQLNSMATDLLLQDFDRVVIEILEPISQNKQLAALIPEFRKLEEEIGPQAVLDRLDEFDFEEPQLRELYIDMLVRVESWTQVINRIGHIQYNELSRLELEHLLFAYAEAGSFDAAKEVILFHQEMYDDIAAKLLRRGISQQYVKLTSDT